MVGMLLLVMETPGPDTAPQADTREIARATNKNRSRYLKPASRRVNAPTDPPTRRGPLGECEGRHSCPEGAISECECRHSPEWLHLEVVQLIRAGRVVELA